MELVHVAVVAQFSSCGQDVCYGFMFLLEGENKGAAATMMGWSKIIH